MTGLVLTNDERVSIGRDRKRELRATVHHFALGKLSLAEIAALNGHIAFAKDVDPEFYTRMERVYGKAALEELRSAAKGFKRPDKR